MNKVIIVYFQNRERGSKKYGDKGKELTNAILNHGDDMRHMSVIVGEPSFITRLRMIDSAIEGKYNRFEKSDYLIITDATDLPLRYMDGFAYINIDEYID